MKIRSILTDKIYKAEWSTESSASSYGQLALVIKETGEAVDSIWYEEVEE